MAGHGPARGWTVTSLPRAVLVTGAAAGIGAAVAGRFVDAGWQVVAFDRDGRALRAAWSAEPLVSAHAVDITDAAAIDDAINAAGLARLDACINVAGVYPPSTFVSFTEADFRMNFDINVLGTLQVSRSVLPLLSAADSAIIVNFASIGAYTATGTLTLYKAAKAAIVSLTRSMAIELAPRIRVVGIAPGPVATEQSVASGGTAVFDDSVPLGRVAQPAEIAEWAFALAGDRPLPFITGETIVVSGGAFMR